MSWWFTYCVSLVLLSLFAQIQLGAPLSTKSKSIPQSPFQHFYGHLECSVAVDDFNAGNVDVKKFCREADYFQRIKNLLNTTADTRENGWLTNILNSLVTMYDDLKFARSPAIVHLGGHHLNATSKAIIHPISACIPEERVLNERLNKSRPIGLFTYHQHLTHGAHASLLVDHDDDIEKSYFVLAQLQAIGWDAPYNVQILSRGALPLHLNLRRCPHSAMTAHPKQVFQNILKIPGLSLTYNKQNASQSNHHLMVRCDLKALPLPVYDLAVQALLRYTHNVLTTSAMAAYMLETVLDEDIHSGTPIKNFTSFAVPSVASGSKTTRQLSWFGGSSTSTTKKTKEKKGTGTTASAVSASATSSESPTENGAVPRLTVLYLTHHPHDAFQDDFLTDLVLHGLIRVLGAASVTDYPRRSNLYYDSSIPAVTANSSNANKTSKHDWDLRILDARSSVRAFTAADIKTAIETHKYDLVIIASDHHRDEFDQHHPTHSGKTVPVEVSSVEFYDQVCRYYKPSEVVYIDGSEHHLTRKLLERYANCVGHFFSREGFVDSV